MWCLCFYPNGDNREKSEGHIGVYLKLLSKNVRVRVLYHMRLVDRSTMFSSTIVNHQKTTALLSTVHGDGISSGHGSHRSTILKKSVLEKSSFIINDSLLLECDITVIKEPHVVKSTVKETSIVRSPRRHRSLMDDLLKLRQMTDEADVFFCVQGQILPAHTIILAMRSPVFNARFHNPLRLGRGRRLVMKIEDMRPEVFSALLHFMYRDSMRHCMRGLTRVEKIEFRKDLLVAADRYDIEKLKLDCERRLCKSLDVENSSTMLSVADQHNFSMLRGACIEFICHDTSG